MKNPSLEGIVFLWLRIAESWRTLYSENSEVFDVDEEFFRLNPTVDGMGFERMLLGRYGDDDDTHLKRVVL